MLAGWSGRTEVQLLVLWPHSKRVLGSIPGQGVSVQSWHVLSVPVWVLSGYSGFLSQSKNMQTGGMVIGYNFITG